MTPAQTPSMSEQVRRAVLAICAAEVYAVDTDDRETLCATLLGTARNVNTAARSDRPS